jgi:predicted transcriptional regulator
MKTLSLKLDDKIFEATEQVIADLNLARNRYINEALDHYNQLHKRSALQRKLERESRVVAQSSAEVLVEFEQLGDDV